jgi:hypothetical protein
MNAQIVFIPMNAYIGQHEQQCTSSGVILPRKRISERILGDTLSATIYPHNADWVLEIETGCKRDTDWVPERQTAC